MSEISGIFFSTLAEKKIQTYFSPRKKSRVIFPQNCIFQTEKNQRYFSKLSIPIFLPNLWITDEKTNIIFWPKLRISDGNKKIPPYFCKNCLFLAEIKKYPLFLPKSSKSCAGKKKYRDPRKGVSECLQYLFQGKKKYDTFEYRLDSIWF